MDEVFFANLKMVCKLPEKRLQQLSSLSYTIDRLYSFISRSVIRMKMLAKSSIPVFHLMLTCSVAKINSATLGYYEFRDNVVNRL